MYLVDNVSSLLEMIFHSLVWNLWPPTGIPGAQLWTLMFPVNDHSSPREVIVGRIVPVLLPLMRILQFQSPPLCLQPRKW